MKSGRIQPADTHNLERFIKILETPFDEVCRALGLEQTERAGFLEIENCIFMFDSQKDYVFSGAVVTGQRYGFFGVKVAGNWLEAAGKLESQGFKQASDLERFTKPGQSFSVSVYLYPDDSREPSSSTVKEYSVCVRYGHAL